MTEETLTESDTRAKFITPALHRRGWHENMIRREETAGAIELVGDVVRRSPDKRADYVLRVKAGGEARSRSRSSKPSATRKRRREAKRFSDSRRRCAEL